MSYKKDKLANLVDAIFSGGTPSTRNDKFWNGNLPWLSSGETRNRFITETEKYITQCGVNDSSTKLANKNDIVIASAGQGHTRGQTSFLKIDTYINQSVIAIRAKKNVIHPLWLFYNLSSRYEEMRQLSDSHSSRGSLTTALLKIIDIEYPDYKSQEKIAKILGDLDDKIALNTQINQTLEAMAQALFKSWFVDFDPVKAKMEARASGGSDDAVRRAAMAVISGKSDDDLVQLEQENPEAFGQLAATADLFPEALVESELGLIPEGWEVTTFGEVSVCYDRMRIPLSNREREGKKGDIPYYGATSVMDYVNEALFDDIYLLLGEDGSVLKPDGTPFIQYIWGKAWVNNHAHVLQGHNDVSTEHLMVFISTQNITAYVTGAVQLKLNQKNMNSIPFVKADIRVNNSFAEKLHALYAIVRSNFDENKELIQTRDLLLPKLLSGEIDLTYFGEVNA